MSLQSLLFVLYLAVTTRAWPQLPNVGSDGAITLHIPYTSRSLPEIEESESLGTLHVPGSSFKPRRSLPIEQDSPGTVTLPIIHAPKPALVRRDIEVELEKRSDVAYYAQLFIGTPPQEVYAQLDTGSFELWVNPQCASLSNSADKKFCEATGQYNAEQSSTSTSVGDSRTISYGLGKADIKYYSDSVGFSSGSQLKGVHFGVAEGDTDEQFAGVLGIGAGKGVNTKYPNVLDELVDQKAISVKAFSVALGNKDEDGGVIVFGGVDTAKFAGDLAELPIIPAKSSPDGVARYWVAMKSISVASPGSSAAKEVSGTEMAVFLDTGATLTLLPASVVKAVAAELGSDEMDTAGFYPIDCSLTDKDGTVDFAFEGLTVKVPYKEIIRSYTSGGTQQCYLGMSPSEDFALLGDTFLRSAFVVFDLDSDSVFMAQYENCGSQVSTIKRSSTLRSLKGTCGSSAASADDTEEASSTTTTSASSTSKPSETEKATTFSTKTRPTVTSSDQDTTTKSTKTKEASTSPTTSDSPETTVSKAEATKVSDDEPEASQEGQVNNAKDNITEEEEDEDNGAVQKGHLLGISIACIVLMTML